MRRLQGGKVSPDFTSGRHTTDELTVVVVGLEVTCALAAPATARLAKETAEVEALIEAHAGATGFTCVALGSTTAAVLIVREERAG